MNPVNFTRWLNDPGLLDRESLVELRKVLEDYPCFTIARILYQKNLLQLQDVRFSKELVRTAISVPDRKRLCFYMEDKPFSDAVYAHQQELSEGEGFSIIDRFLCSAATETALSEPLLSLGSGSDYLSYSMPDQTGTTTVLQQEDFSLDYIGYLSQASSDVKPENAMLGQSLIDAFLSGESDRTVCPVEKNDDSDCDALIDTSETDELLTIVDLPDDTFTETLAKIYLKQKRYDQALEIFKRLSLKYPEKNVYFADQIRFLEKLIINIKNC